MSALSPKPVHSYYLFLALQNPSCVNIGSASPRRAPPGQSLANSLEKVDRQKHEDDDYEDAYDGQGEPLFRFEIPVWFPRSAVPKLAPTLTGVGASATEASDGWTRQAAACPMF